MGARRAPHPRPVPVLTRRALNRAALHRQLDSVFVALADPTRRGVIRCLGRGPTNVGELAREFPMTLPSFMKHVRMLESHGLIRTAKSVLN